MLRRVAVAFVVTLAACGVAANDQGYGVATDAAGNVFVTGSTDGALDGNTNAGLTDLFLAKYAPDGRKR